MCLTGVDYFSTLGYQPGIAFLAAGAPVADRDAVLVLLTLFGALPIYSRVAELSPHGQGSISMLEELLPRWRGKAFVLCLLGFAATDFVITITLSAADATAHIIENPFVPPCVRPPDRADAGAAALLSARSSSRASGRRSASRSAIVGVYLVLNVVVIGVGPARRSGSIPSTSRAGGRAARRSTAAPLMMLASALLLFPKLALGLSGFETGVAVMPLVEGDPDDTPKQPAGRIRNTQEAAAHGGADHERAADRQQLRRRRC